MINSKDSSKGYTKIRISTSDMEEGSNIGSNVTDKTYPITNQEKLGRFYIFNQEEFEGLPEKRRNGTDKDAQRLQDIAKKLGFEPETFKDFTKTKIKKKLENYAVEFCNENYSCFACAFLTHGETGKNGPELKGHDAYLNLERDILRHFTANKCSPLAGKPKIFFIQACRGDGEDLFDASTKSNVKKPDLQKVTKLSVGSEAHFLIADSTIPESKSRRVLTKGTTFIQALCDSFDHFLEKSKFTINEVLCHMNRSLAENDMKVTREVNGTRAKCIKKQIASVTTQLTKDICFGKGVSSTVIDQRVQHANSNHFLILASESYRSEYGCLDEQNFKETATKMGFTTRVIRYKNAEDKTAKIKAYFKDAKDGEPYSVFLCAVLTVNDKNDKGEDWYDDFTVGSLMTDFDGENSPQLINVPKILFIQACNPNSEDTIGFDSVRCMTKYEDFPPTYADFLVTHSRSSRYEDAGNDDYKSVFVRSLCDCLLEFQNKLDILQIMQQVNLKMSRISLVDVPLVTTHLTQQVTVATKTNDQQE